MSARDHAWWQRGVIYQVYPRSFQDSNGDGIGDLPGITARLDHLVALGVDAIWISPIYPSPMADFGYDVSDFCGIDSRFGTLADFDRLVAAAHERGLRVILDYVPNHSSDQHPWFIESRSSRHGPKRDWYIWRDPKPDGSPPNNWLSEFGGPAWTFDAATGQFYYHAYLKEQPDLNWRHPEVRAAMLDVLRFWLDRGVDGFRVDAIHHLIEDEALRDNPPNPEWRPGQSPARAVIRVRTMDQPEVHDAVAAMRWVADRYPDRVLIGEAYLPIDRLMAYYGRDLSGFHLPFNFHLLSTPWEPRAIADLVRAYEAALPPGGWPNWVLGNHDRSRLVSRLGAEQARVAATLLLTLRGTPTIYQGEEIGMRDVPIPRERVQDPWERNVPGLGLGRDPVRTPMRWEAGPGAGFTEGESWLPVGDEDPGLNVSAQSRDPRSLFSLYQSLLKLRKSEAALSVGAISSVAVSGNILTYEREWGGQSLAVAMNFGGSAESTIFRRPGHILLSSLGCTHRASKEQELYLSPHEAIIFEYS
ncbi:alpha amylase catalytic region [Methylobacterium sp. 4-46]|uniref:alpha-amylase family glycosyl hydrolase n=1 Tax=Methylobacterium sp. (strain 4-46) TaxID=426117 RepID=UPI000152C6E4|nr:alpha-amylase family glycosyl hydrolase [Methylobacterium sp. 4-46]ACA18621.1 alpha amylase catalytic region [Methylobacterium sp. 4-46]